MSDFETIRDFNLYQINRQGDVLSLFRRSKSGKLFQRKNPFLLKSHISTEGYRSVYLFNNKECFTRTIHRLLAIAFIPNPNNYPCINHIDGIKLNNDLKNLEWCTYSHNNEHARRLGLMDMNGENARPSKLKDYQIPIIRKMRTDGFSNIEIGKKYNVTPNTIWFIIKGKTWKHIIG